MTAIDALRCFEIQYNKGCSTGREGTGAGEGENGEGERRGRGRFGLRRSKKEKQKANPEKHAPQAKNTKPAKKLSVKKFCNLNT